MEAFERPIEEDGKDLKEFDVVIGLPASSYIVGGIEYTKNWC